MCCLVRNEMMMMMITILTASSKHSLIDLLY